MTRSGFKMKAGKEGPMRKNFPSAFKKDENKTSTVDKIKSFGKAVISNLGKVNTNSSTLSDKVRRDYKRNKKNYRDEAQKNTKN